MTKHWTAEMEAKLETLSSADLLFLLARFLDTQKHIDNEVIREMISQVEHELGSRRVPVGAEPETLEPAPTPDPEPEPPATATFRSRIRNISARGRGVESYRLLGSLDGDTLTWADQHPSALVVGGDWCPRGSRAAERRCSQRVEADAGLLVVEIDKAVGERKASSYRAGVTFATEEKTGIRWDDEAEPKVCHRGIKKRNGQFVHVVEVDGVRREYTSG